MKRILIDVVLIIVLFCIVVFTPIGFLSPEKPEATSDRFVMLIELEDDEIPFGEKEREQITKALEFYRDTGACVELSVLHINCADDENEAAIAQEAGQFLRKFDNLSKVGLIFPGALKGHRRFLAIEITGLKDEN